MSMMNMGIHIEEYLDIEGILTIKKDVGYAYYEDKYEEGKWKERRYCDT